MDFLTDEDLSFEVNTGSKIDWTNLFVQPLKQKGQSLRLRPVVSYNNDALYLKGIPVHKFLKAVGQAVCINNKKNVDEGHGCAFCSHIKNSLNPIYVETYYALKELGYDLPEGDLVKLLAARNDAIKTKKDAKITELKDKANKFEMIDKVFYNYLPVIDITDPSRVKLYEHKSSIKNLIRGFHDMGKDIVNSDIIIKREEKPGAYYTVNREDQTPLTEAQKKTIADTLPEVEKAMDVLFGQKASSIEVNAEKFGKYLAKVEGRDVPAASSAPTAQAANVTNIAVPAPESFTVTPY